MKTFLLLTILLNVLVFGLGAGWFSWVPDQSELANEVARPTEFRPKDITLLTHGKQNDEHEANDNTVQGAGGAD